MCFVRPFRVSFDARVRAGVDDIARGVSTRVRGAAARDVRGARGSFHGNKVRSKAFRAWISARGGGPRTRRDGGDDASAVATARLASARGGRRERNDAADVELELELERERKRERERCHLRRRGACGGKSTQREQSLEFADARVGLARARRCRGRKLLFSVHRSRRQGAREA